MYQRIAGRRRPWIVAALVLLALAVAATVFFRPRPIPAPPALRGLDASAERGRYLAAIGNCRTCHTAPGGADYAGGVRFETPFGTLYSTNITGDRARGIGAWSFADFYRSMKYGVRPGGEHLYPAFPYTSFAKLSDDDIASLYLFMRTVPPAASRGRANAFGFPFGERRLLQFWKTLFHDPDAKAAVAPDSREWTRGAYLVEALAHCGACHTPRNALGAERASRKLEGGTYRDQVATGEYRTWSAVNLTPSSRGIGAWSRKDVADYLLTGQNPRAVVHGPMNEVVLNSTRHLERADADAIAAYLKGGAPAGGGFLIPSIRGNFAEGEVVYTVHCGTCHLPKGKGDRVLGVPLARNPIVQADDPASLINVILYGPQLPPPPFVSRRTRMPAFGKRLSDEDVAAVATYLRGSFGNDAGPVTASMVERQR